MAQQQKNITISAPGFGGINTEIAQTEQNEAFASEVSNGVVDRYGRIGARKGFTITTTDGSAYSAAEVEVVHAHLNEAGDETVLSAAGLELYKAEDVPVNITPGAATITANHWQILTFNDDAYFLQKDHAAIKYDDSAGTAAVAADIPEGDCGIAAYGRLWVANITGDTQRVYWSNLLVGDDFTAGDTGSINIAEFWPSGYDEIQALAAHNGFLIIFGKENILVYSGADGSPASTLELVDTVKGIGCIARDTVASTGTDVLWLDSTGVRSFARTIQEKSMSIGDVSANVRTDIIRSIAAEADISLADAVYSPEESFYLVLFRDSSLIYCFNTSAADERGAMRATTWTGIVANHATNTSFGRLLLAGSARIGTYSGYQDAGLAYNMRWFSNPFTFDSSVHLKFPKQIDFTLLAGNGGVATVYWAFDYSQTYRTKNIQLSSGVTVAEYGVAEFGDNGDPLAEYTGGVSLLRKKANVGGSGVVVTIGIEVSIDGEEFSIQEINIQALTGRIV